MDDFIAEQSDVAHTLNALDVWQTSIRAIGQRFEDATHFREVACKYAIGHGRDFSYVKNEPCRVVIQCTKKNCNWRIRASYSKVDGTFSIRTGNFTHTCETGLDGNEHPKFSKNLVASIIRDRIRSTPGTKPSDIMKEFVTSYGVDVPYMKVWRGKEQAREELHGQDALSFNSLKSYREAVMAGNPGSVFEFEVNSETDQFLRLFVAFHACVEGFHKGCRPILFVDGAHLKHRYKGVLCAATTIDANDEIFNVAFAIVDAENDDNWRWFFRMLRSCLTRERSYVFMSDRQPGILKAVASIFPDAYHLHCFHHLVENFKSDVRN
jgi:zinc finger SWIM domain-containing protein 3